VRTGELEAGYFEAGPDDSEAVLLLHGFPYDIHSYVDVIPLLPATGRRVIVPYMRVLLLLPHRAGLGRFHREPAGGCHGDLDAELVGGRSTTRRCNVRR
jgi:hypothetical protein